MASDGDPLRSIALIPLALIFGIAGGILYSVPTVYYRYEINRPPIVRKITELRKDKEVQEYIDMGIRLYNINEITNQPELGEKFKEIQKNPRVVEYLELEDRLGKEREEAMGRDSARGAIGGSLAGLGLGIYLLGMGRRERKKKAENSGKENIESFK